MRHLRSILYALILAPAVWVLLGAGPRVPALIAAGVAYGILLLGPFSPAGPVLAGLAFLGAGLWAAASGPGALDRPGYGTALVLAVPLLATGLNATRWARHVAPEWVLGRSRAQGDAAAVAEDGAPGDSGSAEISVAAADVGPAVATDPGADEAAVPGEVTADRRESVPAGEATADLSDDRSTAAGATTADLRDDQPTAAGNATADPRDGRPGTIDLAPDAVSEAGDSTVELSAESRPSVPDGTAATTAPPDAGSAPADARDSATATTADLGDKAATASPDPEATVDVVGVPDPPAGRDHGEGPTEPVVTAVPEPDERTEGLRVPAAARHDEPTEDLTARADAMLRRARESQDATQVLGPGERTQVIPRDVVTPSGPGSEDPGDRTQVINFVHPRSADIAGDRTQRLNPTPTDERTQRLSTPADSPDDHTQPLSIPPDADESPTRPQSILGQEREDPAADPTTRLTRAPVEAADDEPTTEVDGDRVVQRTGEAAGRKRPSFKDMERPADEAAQDTRRIVPAQRRPEDEKTSRR